MRKLFAFLSAMLLAVSVFAQAPEKMSYQAVIRNSNGELVTNKQVSLRVSILKGSASGSAVFTQTLNPTTNANGLASVEIEGGTFSTINWNDNTYYIKTECDPANGTNYTITGSSQILSVPYALYAKSAENFKGDSIFFEDNGQIASFDQNHRIMFRRTENILELREYGKIVFSSGSNTGNATNQMTLLADGNVVLNNRNIRNVADPVNAQDAATKAYVDALKNIIIEEFLDAGLNGILKDIDGNTYKTIKIGNQVWMAENLKTTQYNDGTEIPLVTDKTAWNNLTTPGYCWYNNDQATYRIPYGALYNWYTVNSGKLCPAGWHVSTDAEWTTLTDYLGGQSVAGDKLKETGTTHWYSSSGATNETGFTALPGGYRMYGSFWNFRSYGYWWCATESDADEAWGWEMGDSYHSANRLIDFKTYGRSVRCVRN